MASSQKLQEALDQINAALTVVSAHINSTAFKPGIVSDLRRAEECLRDAADLVARERNSLGYAEIRASKAAALRQSTQ